MLFDKKLGIKKRYPHNASEKICKFYEKYLGYRQNRHLKSDLQKSREEAFLIECNDLCDVSLVDALDRLKDKPVVKNFLTMQREKGRPGRMPGILERRPTTTGADLADASTSETSGLAQNYDTSVDPTESIASSISSISLADNSKIDPDYVCEVKIKAPQKKTKRRIDRRTDCCRSGQMLHH